MNHKLGYKSLEETQIIPILSSHMPNGVTLHCPSTRVLAVGDYGKAILYGAGTVLSWAVKLTVRVVYSLSGNK